MNIVKRLISRKRRELESKIKDESRHYEFTLSDVSRIKLIRMYEDYRRMFGKEYKG